MSDWIRVEDRLPPGQWSINHPFLSKTVFIRNDVAAMSGFYNRANGTWYTRSPADLEWVDDITHWMPIPEVSDEQRAS